MLLHLSHLVSLVSLPWSFASSLSFSDIRRGSAFHLPLYRRGVSIETTRRVPNQGAIGLGDYIDVCVLNYTIVASSSQNQNIQCAGSSRRNAFSARSRYASQLHGNVYHPDLTSQILALPIFGCSLALAPRTVSLLLSRYTPRPPSSRVDLPFALSTVTL